MGMGQVLEKNITDQFYYLYKGSQWLTIIPPTRVSQLFCRICDWTRYVKMDPVIPLSSPWFDSIQPQLYSSTKNFYGKPVIHTRLESGDIKTVMERRRKNSYGKFFLLSLNNFILRLQR